MVRSVGIDPGEHAVKVVELDGSYRKTRLLRVHHTPLPGGGERPAAVAQAVRAAVDAGMRGEASLAQPCRVAVLRGLELPFRGTDQLRKVVKAEIEGEIHSHTVDDMVVDFHEIGPGAAGGTRVLVAAVPKAPLRAQLDALTAVAIEPEVVDLDTMALWRAAHWTGAFAPAAGAEPPAEGQPPAVTAVVDVGARSTKVLLVEGEQLVDMRALRLGDAAVADEVARRHGLDAATAAQAVAACLQQGADQQLEVAEALPAAADGAEAPAPAKRQVAVTHAEVEAAHAAFRQRLGRELVRYLAASGRAGRIGVVWCTGGACRGPGVLATLQEAFGVAPQELDVLAHLQHDLDAAEADALRPQLAVAVGMALGRLGGPEGLQLRQEELVLTRGFERVKFPLAIACMVALLALFVQINKLSTELRLLELEIGRTYVKDPKAAPQFHGMVNQVFASKWFENPQYFRFEQTRGKDYIYKDLLAELLAAPVHKRVQIVRDRLRQVADQKQKDSGIYEDVTLESGLAVLVRFAQVLKSVEPQLGRYLLTRLYVNMKAPSRRLEFTIAFRGEDFRTRQGALLQALDAEYGKSDTPFARPRDGAKEEPFKDAGETGVSGAYYRFAIDVKDAFEPFGPSNPRSVGALPARSGGGDALAAATEVR